LFITGSETNCAEKNARKKICAEITEPKEIARKTTRGNERRVSEARPLSTPRPWSSYDLRPRTHDKRLLNKTSYLNDREFVIRMLYRDSY